jgi:hypothetical protein
VGRIRYSDWQPELGGAGGQVFEEAREGRDAAVEGLWCRVSRKQLLTKGEHVLNGSSQQFERSRWPLDPEELNKAITSSWQARRVCGLFLHYDILDLGLSVLGHHQCKAGHDTEALSSDIMQLRGWHRLIGIIMLIPMVGWVVTGLLFFIKPGYAGAYEILNVKSYPFDKSVSISADPGWHEFRYLRTAIGYHAIARTDKQWRHINLETMQERGDPNEEELRLLLNDAISTNRERYGQIVSVSGKSAKTDTGVEITVDWNRLTLLQKGNDTDWIDLLYRIHYLQWTGLKSVDRILGVVGLALLMSLTLLGARLAFK